MNFTTAREMIGVIRAERQVRANRLRDEDQDFAYDQWLSIDEPFVNDMCLMVLIALRHQVERELIFIAACVDVGEAITVEKYHENVAKYREKGWKNLEVKLNLKSFPQWEASMETLRLLANCLKHEPTQEPNRQLLEHLGLPPKPEERFVDSYAALSESRSFKEGLAEYVKLPRDADYCRIAETFVYLASEFLELVRKQTPLAQITGPVSLVKFSG
jgi:hypothetical protein